jgi:hypothetical protein
MVFDLLKILLKAFPLQDQPALLKEKKADGAAVEYESTGNKAKTNSIHDEPKGPS